MRILDRIKQELDAVTPEQLEAAARALMEPQEGEEVIGCVNDDPYVKRIWAQAHEYDRRGTLAAFALRFGKTSDRKQARRGIDEIEMMEGLFRDLAWVEIRHCFPQLLDYDSIGLRTGYVVVATNRLNTRRLENTLGMLRETMQKAFGISPEDDEEEQEKEKVQ